MRSLSIVLVLAMATSLFYGCSKSSDDSPASTTLGKGGTILSAANKALESSGNLIDPATSGPVLQSINPLSDPCPGFGTDSNSTADAIYCMITENSGSPETARGALSLISQIVTGLEANITFQYQTTPTSHENISFSVTTSDGTANVTASIREQSLSNNVWDNKIDICLLSFNGQTMSASLQACVDNGFFYTIYLKQTDSVLAFKGVQRMDLPLVETVLFHLDRTNGELRYNSWSLANGNQHRFYVKGAIAADYTMTTIEKAAFAHARAGYDDEDNPTSIANWSAAYAFYNGADLCINYQSSAPVDNDWTISGDCTGKMPSYNTAFHAFLTQASGLLSFSENDAKGILNFNDSTFTVGSFFIDN